VVASLSCRAGGRLRFKSFADSFETSSREYLVLASYRGGGQVSEQ